MKALKNLLKFTTFIIIFVFLLDFTSDTFRPTWLDKDWKSGQAYTIRGFYEEKPNSLDVIFIGDSNLYKGISPLELWQDYGITSYNYGISSARIYTMYYLMQETLRYQKPKVIVMDTATMFYNKMEVEPERRKSFDYMPFSTVKLDAINDPIFDNDPFEKLSYVFPVFRYHTRWNEFENKDIIKNKKNYKNLTKGYFYTDVIYPQEGGWNHMQPNPNAKKPKMMSYTEEYFKLVSDYCKKNDIKLLMIGLPDKRTWKYNDSVAMKEYSQKYQVDYLDLNNDTYGFDWKKDLSDKPGVHANIYGAVKLTKEVGKYLDANYNLPDHSKDKEYKSWNDDLKVYNKLKEESYKKLEELNEYNNKEDRSKKYRQKTTKSLRARYTY